jgi:hypothetical protein
MACEQQQVTIKGQKGPEDEGLVWKSPLLRMCKEAGRQYQYRPQTQGPLPPLP